MLEIKASISRERLYMRNYESEIVNIVKEGLENDEGDFYGGLASFLAFVYLSVNQGKEDEDHGDEGSSVC